MTLNKRTAVVAALMATGLFGRTRRVSANGSVSITIGSGGGRTLVDLDFQSITIQADARSVTLTPAEIMDALEGKP